MGEAVDEVRIEIDATRCVGSGICEALEPQAVELGDDGYAHPIPSVGLSEERARTVAANCPTQAISVFEVEGPS